MQGIAQINLADCDSSSEMQLRWYPVQVFASPDPPRPKEPVLRVMESTTQETMNASSGKTVHGPGSRSQSSMAIFFTLRLALLQVLISKTISCRLQGSMSYSKEFQGKESYGNIAI